MLDHSLTVVSHDHDQSCVVPTLFFQESKEVAQRRIRVGNLAIVEPILVDVSIRRRRLVRIVRIVEVHPHEMWTRWWGVEPRFCSAFYLHTAALRSSPPGI